MITRQNILFHELIGLDVLVVSADNRMQCSVRGLVVYETRNMLHIRTTKKVVKVPKRGTTFACTLPDGSRVMFNGTLIAVSPQRRTSMRITTEV